MTQKEVSQLGQTLLTLQHQFIEHKDNDQRQAKRTLQYYTELCEETQKKAQKSLNFAWRLMTNDSFLEALNAADAALYVPAVTAVWWALEGHQQLPAAMLSDHPDKLSSIVLDLLLHTNFACDSLSNTEEEEDDDFPRYKDDESHFVIESAARVIYRLVGKGGAEMLSFVVREHPRSTDVVNRCAGLREGNRDLSKLALLFVEESERVVAAERRHEAAAALQAHWRGVHESHHFRHQPIFCKL